MKVRDIMTRNPKTIPPSATIQAVAKEMQELDCGCMPIAKNGEILGIVTDRDITTRAVSKNKDAETTPIEDIMTSDVYHVLEDDDLNTAAKEMCQHQIRRLIVLNKDKEISGVLALGDIATRYKNHEVDAKIIEKVSEKEQLKAA